MFVASMMRRRGDGRKARRCSEAGSEARRGMTSSSARTSARRSAVSRMSRSPGRKTSMSPSGGSSATAAATSRGRSRSSSSGGGRYAISIGKRRPGTDMTGALPKKAEKRAASRVADETTTLRSRRFSRMRFRMPSRKSTLRVRSCASSIIMVSYARSRASKRVSARRTPSVMNSMRVSDEMRRAKRCRKPTSPPTSALSSSATRSATVTAARRRGCVQTMRRPCAARPSSSAIFGSWVVLPEPVSPQTMTTGLAFMADSISALCSHTGSSGG